MAQVIISAKLYVYISGVWTELNDAQPWRFDWGISGNRPTDRIADTGDLTFTLDNSTGQYTPGGPSALAGWRKGLPIKLVVTYDGEDYIRWRGIIDDIDIKPKFKDKKAYVSCVDWLDYATRNPIINPGIDTNKRGNQVLDWVMANVSVPPQQTDFDTGIETFSTVFDTVTSRTRAYNEFAKVAFSELGYIYRRANKTDGETLVFEAADARHGWRTPVQIPLSAAESNIMIYEDSDIMLYEDGDTMIYNETQSYTFGLSSGITIEDFEAPYGDQVINRMTVTANPRRLDTSPQVLFNLDQELIIDSGDTYILQGTYADPNGGLPVAGQNMITPVATTDYTMFAATGGGGSNITGSLTITITYGTEGFTARLTNLDGSKGFVNFFQTRGTGIYRPNPIQHTASNSDSVDEFDYNSENINQAYQNTLYSGRVWSESQVDEHHEPRIILNSISFTANKSPAHMMAFLHTDIGDLRYIEITELGLTGNYYIQGIRVEMNNGLIRVTWIVATMLSLLTGCGLSPLAVEFAGSTSEDAVNFGYVPKIMNLENRSVSVWAYHDTSAGQQRIFSIRGGLDGGGFNLGSYSIVANTLRLDSRMFSGGSPIYYAEGALTVGAWMHIVITWDRRSGTASEPIAYVNGTLEVWDTITGSNSGSYVNEAGIPLIVGNQLDTTGGVSTQNGWDGKIFDLRFYNVILTQAQITTLYNSGAPDETLLTDPSTGLIFQAFTVRTGKLADYVDITLANDMLLRDAVFGAVGAPNSGPIGRTAP